MAFAAVSDHGSALRGQAMENLRRAYNAANAMAGVEKRRADRLRSELVHTKGTLAGDSGAMAAFMADHAEVAMRISDLQLPLQAANGPLSLGAER